MDFEVAVAVKFSSAIWSIWRVERHRRPQVRSALDRDGGLTRIRRRRDGGRIPRGTETKKTQISKIVDQQLQLEFSNPIPERPTTKGLSGQGTEGCLEIWSRR